MPAHNEAAYIARTLQSLVDQTERPDRLIVVDDGSTDATPDIVRQFMSQHEWITMVPGSTGGGRRYRVVEVFNHGYARVRDEAFTYVSKIDADLIFPKDYFQRLFALMDRDPAIGAAGGVLNEVTASGRTVRLRMPDNHVPGPIKTIRKSVFDKMGGFVPMLGWDIVDLVHIRSLGYRTVCLPELAVMHLRQTAAATGILKGNVRMGHGAYVIGTHPLFALGRSFYRMFEPPYVLAGAALGYGYFRSWFKRAEQISDARLIRKLREEQLYRLFHFNKLPERKSSPRPS
jgi:glycosyltransferase involved in cell wall biosynthesis